MAFKFFHTTLLSLTSSLALCAASAAQEEPVFSPEDLRSDFSTLYETMKAAHYDINAETPQSVLDQRFEEMLAAIDAPMSRSEAAIYFQTFLAEIRHGHARIDFPIEYWVNWRENGGGALPIDIRIRDGRVWLSDHQTGLASIERGDEILALNGEPNPIWLSRLTRHLSAETPDLAYSLLESYLPVLFLVEYPDAEAVTLRLRKPYGREEDFTLPLVTSEDMAALPEPDYEIFALPQHDARMLAGDIAYLRPGPFYNTDEGGNIWDPTSYIARVDAAFESFIDEDAQALIIDIRDNPGGNNSFSDPIIAWFADEPWSFASEFSIRVSDATTASNQARLDTFEEGNGGVSAVFADLFASSENGASVVFDLPVAEPHEDRQFNAPVYLLINRYSYSNAVTMAATVQDYGFGTIVGEATSDMSTTYGAMESFSLPQTGITAGYPKAHIIRPNGERNSHPVSPDIELDMPYLRGEEDVVLEALRARIAGELPN